MHRLAIASLLALIGCSSHSSTREAEPAPSLPIETRALPNGLSVLAVPHATQIVEQRAEGIELSYRFDARPTGDVRLSFADAKPVHATGGVRLLGRGRSFHVSDGTWIGADGTRVPVSARVDGDAIAYATPERLEFPAILDPTISTELDVDTPVEGVAAGSQGIVSTTFDGANFVAVWSVGLGGVYRARIARISPTGTVLDPYGVVLDGAFQSSLASTGTETLVASLVGSDTGAELRGQRFGKDGKLLDAKATKLFDVPLKIPNAVFARAVGSQYVVAVADAYDQALYGHVTSAGAKVESTMIDLGATSDRTSSIACASSGQCLISVYVDPYGFGGAFVSATGVTGARQIFDAGWFGGPVVSNGTDYFGLGTDTSTYHLVGKKISSTGTVSAANDYGPFAGGYRMDLASTSTGWLIGWSTFTDVVAMATNATGAPAWSTTVATLPTKMDNPAPVAVSSGAGAGLVAYSATSVKDGITKARGVRFDLASKPTATSPFAIARGAPAQYHAAVASDGTNYLVAWEEENDAVHTVRARTFDGTGAPKSAPVTLETLAAGRIANDLSASWDGARYHVVYRQFEQQNYQLEHVRIASDGSLVDATPVLADDGGYFARAPVIVSGKGHTLAAWVDFATVLIRRFDDKGDALDAKPVAVGHSIPSGDPIDENRPAASWDGARFLVAWPQPSGASSDVVAAFVDDGSVGAQFSVSAVPGAQSQLASAFGGGVHLVTWREIAPDVPVSIRGVRIDPTGKVLDVAPVTILTDVCTRCSANVAWDGASFVVTAYGSIDQRVKQTDVKLARVRADGAVVPGSLTVAKSAFVPFTTSQPAMASDGKGNTLIATAALIDDAPIASSRAKLHLYSAKKPAGTACSAGADCDDGNCVDGVCCTSACTGPCEACDAPGSLGTCSPVAGSPHGTRSCGGTGDACSVGACDGKDGSKCASFALAAGNACGTPTCSGASFTAAPTCSDAHVCTTTPKVDCAPYRCGPTGCLKTCASDDQCTGGAKCVAGSCVPSATGAHCSDDKLSSVAKDGTTARCAPYRCDTDGSCAKTCASSDDCVPGFVCDVGAGTCGEVAPEAESSGGCAMHGIGGKQGGFMLLLLGIVGVLARRRRALLGSALVLAGCRSGHAEDVSPVAHTVSSALTVGPETSTVDTTADVMPGWPSSIACNTSGCLLVTLTHEWVVGRRLTTAGAAVDADGFVIANGAFEDFQTVSVASDGTDYGVVWDNRFGVPRFARVTAAGVPSAAVDVAPISPFANSPSVGFDGTSYVVAWEERPSVKDQTHLARFAKDGKHVDDLVTDAGIPRLLCDPTSGCLLLLANAGAGGKVQHLTAGKPDKTTAIGLYPWGIARVGSDVIVTGNELTSGNFAAQKLALDGSAKGTAVTLTGMGGYDAFVAPVNGTAVVVSPDPMVTGDVILARLDASLAIVEKKSVPYVFDSSDAIRDTVPMGANTLLATQRGVAQLTDSPLGIDRKPLENRRAPHHRMAIANHDGTHVVAFAKTVGGKDSVMVTKLGDDGVFSPPGGTLVSAETGPVLDLAIAWDGTQFVLAWLSDTRIAYARLDASLAPVGSALKVADRKTGFVDVQCGLAVGSTGTGAVIGIAAGNEKLQTVRVSAAGALVDTTPKTFAAKALLCELSAASNGGTTLFAWGTGLAADYSLRALRIGSDGAAIDTSAVDLAGKLADGVSRPAILVDGTGWLLGYSTHTPTSLGYDVGVLSLAGDLSDAGGKPLFVSARDPDQREPALAVDGDRVVLTWVEDVVDGTELRASWFDTKTKTLLVDAAKIASFGVGEVEVMAVPRLAGSTALLAYDRLDETVLAERIKARSITFGATQGQTCAATSDCEVGTCVDGVCCERACDGTCESCNEPGSIGKCVTIAGAPRGTRSCGAGMGCAEATCDGFEPKSCVKFAHAFETKCAEPKCEGALYTSTGYCDGKGACAVPTTASCAPYACDPNGCLSSCSSDASCAMGFLCKDGKCVAPEAKATCVDDGLSSQASDGTKKDCAPFRCGSEGTCLKACASSVDCAPGRTCDTSSGLCVEPDTGGDSGGCSVTAASRISPTRGTAALLLLAFAWLRARARKVSRP